MESERNLAKEMPQAAHRARAYKLEDNGAVDLATRRRWKKDAKQHPPTVEGENKRIEQLKKRLENPEDSIPKKTIEKWIRQHEKKIRQIESGSLDILRPDASLIAPMTRRVAREDRRRAKREAIEKRSRNG